MMDKICVSLGGALISSQNGFNTKYVLELSRVIQKEKNSRFTIMCGGGYHAKMLIEAAKKAGVVSNIELDKIGIRVTKMNALVVRDIFEANGLDVVPNIPNSTDEFRNVMRNYRVIVAGGFIEGVTTDADAVLAAEAMGCKSLINVSKIGYVYNKDPNKFSDAKKHASLTYAELIKISSESDERKPRSHVIFDSIAALLAARSKIEVRFVDGNIKNFEAAIHGKPHNGTTVKA